MTVSYPDTLATPCSDSTAADDLAAQASRDALDRYSRALNRARTVAAIDAAQRQLYADLDAARSIAATTGTLTTAIA